MTQVTCPGLPAEWINGWLAAVGATVLDARIRLHWMTDGVPLAVLSSAEIDPVDALVESWPDIALLSDLPIAENWKGAGKVGRKVPVERKVKIFSRPTSLYCAKSCNRHGKQKSALVEPQCFPPLRLST